jgi:ribonuclease HII
MARQAKEKFTCTWQFEHAAIQSGLSCIAGVDEVGRGPLFGPVVAAAVILPLTAELPGLTDSKQLTEARREILDVQIRACALCFAIAEVDAATIDRINIREATKLAMKNAVNQLAQQPDLLLIDGNMRINLPHRQQTIVKGDAQSFSIAAASILAKVHRDRMLVEYEKEFPGYGLAQHKGYGTAAHLAALRQLGPTPQHRRSFAPVRLAAALELPSSPGLFAQEASR